MTKGEPVKNKKCKACLRREECNGTIECLLFVAFLVALFTGLGYWWGSTNATPPPPLQYQVIAKGYENDDLVTFYTAQFRSGSSRSLELTPGDLINTCCTSFMGEPLVQGNAMNKVEIDIQPESN
jgi:hypothetical protein